MILVSDIGNTHTSLGLFKDDTLILKWNVQTSKERTTDEWGLTFKSFFEMHSIKLSEISGVAISSVVPPAVFALKQAAQKYLNCNPLMVGPGIKTGLSLRYDNPKEIGADRVVNAVAAKHYYKKAAIIIDFGTATTFDCVSNNGEYLGGVICPGIGISLDALVTKTAKLSKVEIAKPPSVIGKTTEHAMQSGILYGYTSMVDGLIKRLIKEMNDTPVIIATGGLSQIITQESETIEHYEPDLAMNGLKIIFEKNR
ncbi:MAG: type III pantothenate kinase [Deltaproteobacteria bacterium]|nr:type III pantothenate kinase [Deltaproteobacteria bacterium]